MILDSKPGRPAAAILRLLAAGWLAACPVVAAVRPQSEAEARLHWAFLPLGNPSVPSDSATPAADGGPVDAFLRRSLAAKGLEPSPSAPAAVVLRRLHYALIGLPPSDADHARFAEAWNRSAEMAVEGEIDRLLADPRYGERWGRHWLDVARYADTKDLVLQYGTDAIRPFAYTYRDYVVRAFNEDLPFDAFIRDQLAADLESPQVPSWRLAAMGFLTLGRLFDNNVHDQIDDQIDTVTRGFLGLTVSCARCHDHKYDAVPQADYYGLYGVFASSERPAPPPLIEDPASVPGGPEFEQRMEKARKELEDHVDAEFVRLSGILRGRIGEYLVRAVTTPPDLTETAQFGLSLTPEDFRPTLMLRTRRFVARRAVETDHVFGPWARLMALPEAVFPIAAADLRPRLGNDLGWNPLVVGFLVGRGVTNRADVARAYGELLVREWTASQATNASPSTADSRELVEIVTGKDSPVGFARRDTPDHMSRPEKDRWGGLVQNLDKIAAHATNRPPARAMVLRDLPEPIQPRIFVRGSPARPGDPVQRAFLRVLTGGEVRPFGAGSGRLGLAAAIASPTNPLTARVFVNRVWMEHFGEPLVATPADFGARSEPPTHPELLDWLAADFIRSGWSVKHLHRVLLRSAAFRQSGEDAASPSHRLARSVDPENRLLWHHPRRRLDLEAMRDTLLHVSGRLDPARGGRPVDVASDPANRRRTVYGLVDRQNLPGLFRSFDFAVPDQCVERRPRTTVPQQALFLMNSSFVHEQVHALASLPSVAGERDPVRRVEAVFRRVLGRPPSGSESAAALRFLGVTDTGQVDDSRWEPLIQAVLATNELVFLD
jgi:hypothetical protein